MARWAIAAVVAAGVCAGGGRAAAQPGPAPADGAVRGPRVKVDADPRTDGTLVADAIEVIDGHDDDEWYEIEGRINDVDRDAKTFRMHRFLFTADSASVFYEETQDRVRSFPDLVLNLRVKVKANRGVGGLLRAEAVRLQPDNDDDDIEIEGPVESLNVRTSEFLLAGEAIVVNSDTEIGEQRGVGLDGLLDGGSASGIRRDDDEPSVAPLTFGRVTVGGKVGYGLDLWRNRDLDARRDDDVNQSGYEAQIEVSARPSRLVEAYGRLNIRHDRFSGSSPVRAVNTAGEVREAYLLVSELFHPNVALQVGRQRFRDQREWWYDDRLDAARVHYTQNNWTTEVGIAKTLAGATGSRSDQLYVIARTELRLPKRTFISGHFLKRSDTTDRDEDPVWYGLSTRGRVTNQLRYWSELALVRGHRGARRLRAWGGDAGASYEMRSAWRPTVALSYAYGSGDDNFDDGIDGNFRQTRLNDNSARIRGLKRYRYYGVALEPELSNLQIRTLDLGLRPSDAWSLNVAFHDYRQATIDDRLGGAEIDLEPAGRAAAFGHAIDVVLAVRRFSRVDINLLAGWFRPGPAFEGPRSPFVVFAPEIRYFF